MEGIEGLSVQNRRLQSAELSCSEKCTQALANHLNTQLAHPRVIEHSEQFVQQGLSF